MGARFASYAAVQDYLFGLKARGVNFGIDRMRLWSEAIGNPHAAVPCIHVAGTNGKGSTSAMIEALLRASGARAGLYTSPHLVRLGERIQVDRQTLGEANILRYTETLAPIAEDVSRASPDDHPSFFEFMTAMAFMRFRDAGCQWNVIEVGMGGRLDATNIVTPEVSVITSIGLDHCEFLGRTLGAIAREKAGIVKRRVPVVIGWLPPEAEEVVRAVAAERDSPVLSVREALGDDLSVYPSPSLLGDHQRINAATALLTVKQLGARVALSLEQAEKALADVRWAGRWDVRQIDGRTVILDASHNAEGATVLDASLATHVAHDPRKPIVVAGALGVDRARPLIDVLSKYAGELVFVAPRQPRATPTAELRALVPGDFRGPVREAKIEDVFPRTGRCALGQRGDLILVTGSIYLLGEALVQLEPPEGGFEGKLQDF